MEDKIKKLVKRYSITGLCHEDIEQEAFYAYSFCLRRGYDSRKALLFVRKHLAQSLRDLHNGM